MLPELLTLSAIDRQFSAFICRQAKAPDEPLRLAVALLSQAVASGHVCLDLREVAGRILSIDGQPAALPALAFWTQALQRSGAVGTGTGELQPLVLTPAGRLYLTRHWQDEVTVADFFMAPQALPPCDEAVLADWLPRLFTSELAPDWQRVAAETALHGRVTVISGGPGTGKTTTVARIMALLALAGGVRGEEIAIAAPTGKAAARLGEAIGRALATLPLPAELVAQLPRTAVTLHRLLGRTGRQGEERQLTARVVIVDEASMVALPLLARLVRAMLPTARLILLGDRDQLASVEAGAVLGDLCATPAAESAEIPAGQSATETQRHGEEIEGKICTLPPGGGGLGWGGMGHVDAELRLHPPPDPLPSREGEVKEAKSARVSPPSGPLCLRGGSAGFPLAERIVLLRHTYRFGSTSGIGQMSRLVCSGAGDAALAVCQSGDYPDLVWHELPAPRLLDEALRELVVTGYGPYLAAADPAAALQRFEEFRLLAAVREGEYGVAGLNERIERLLARQGLIHPRQPWYRGRPVLVTTNDYGVRLANGDIGLTLPDPAHGHELRVFFATPDGGLRSVHPLRLPAHETAYALTVHKSQGSEFDTVALVLPPEDLPLLTRELIYTGLTRAREQVQLLANAEVFCAAVSRRVSRSSGLREALWGG